jgi:hypothetical protein
MEKIRELSEANAELKMLNARLAESGNTPAPDTK